VKQEELDATAEQVAAIAKKRQPPSGLLRHLPEETGYRRTTPCCAWSSADWFRSSA
jgi:hypothetical protein